MAYRRRQGITRASTFKEEIYHKPEDETYKDNFKTSKLRSSYTFNASSSLAAQAIRASAVHRDSSLSSAYTGDSVSQRSKVFDAYEDSSERSDNKGFWGVLAKKAKSILEDDNISQQFETPARSRFQMSDTPMDGQSPRSNQSQEGSKKIDSPTFRKGLDKLTSSLNQIGDSFEKAFEEGLIIMENKTADIIQETRKLQIRRKGNGLEAQNQASSTSSSWQQPMMQPKLPQNQMNHETQLKASRDVAMATAAKAKLLLRELKTVKADLAFAKQRCSQLEDENKILRESREKGGNPADDDLIRLQLETLLAEKARLAHENSIFSRENRFLREIVEYHQLTMQDVVYFDEGSEEVSEVYPITRMFSITPTSPISPLSPCDTNASPSLEVTKEIYPVPIPPEELQEASTSDISAVSTLPKIDEAAEGETESKPANENKEEDAKGTTVQVEHNAETTS
ncbi:uncharacterized protein [Euphorbia lathyris]|uniref:uncharacterized protein n=1 Tax=Euphorbia lathyris TaxID=212925 RepID=UPI0033136EC5